MTRSIKIKGVWGGVYDLPPDPSGLQSNVMITKKDGQTFYIPVADLRAIGAIVEAQIRLAAVLANYENGVEP